MARRTSTRTAVPPRVSAEVHRLALPELLREPPPTARGVRTRVALVHAPRAVFERDGRSVADALVETSTPLWDDALRLPQDD